MSNVPPIIVPIETRVTNTKEISDAIFKAFQEGLSAVMKSQAYKRGLVTMFNHLGKTIEKSMAKSMSTIAADMTKAFAKAQKAAQSSATAAGNAWAHIVPGSGAAAVKRLTDQFDRLEATIKNLATPSKSLEHTLAGLNKSIARTTTEAARQQTAAQNTALQNQAANANAAAKTRVAIITAMAGQIRALERGIGQAVKISLSLATSAVHALASAYRRMGESARAGSRAAVSAVKTIATAIASVTRAVARMATGLASGFARGFGKVSSALTGAMRRDEGTLRSSLSRREKMVSSSAQRQSSGLSRIFSLQNMAAAAGGFGVGSLLTSGFERFGAQEQLQLTFTTLLHDGDKATKVLAEISEFARTTAFDFTEVAGSVAQLTAGLGDVDEAMNLTKFLADVTALTGGSTDQLAHARLAFSQIAGSGRVAVNDINQLVNALPGIPIMQIIADKFFGGDVEAANAAREAGELGGELSADEFFDAFQDGVHERFPEIDGFAQQAAGTVSGLAANLKENFAIFGATLVGVVEGPIKSFIGGVNTAMEKAGDFISGKMFEPGIGADNIFKDVEDDAKVMFEDLPAEFQRQLEALGEGWSPGMWVSGADAKEWWANANPPEVNEALENLKKLRDILGDIAKVLAVLVGFKIGSEVFQLLGKGLLGMFTNVNANGVRSLSFFKILGVSIFGAALAISVFTKFSAKFAEKWGKATAAFRPMIASFVRLGSAFKKAFSESDKKGVVGFISGIGDSLSGVGTVVYRVFTGLQKFSDTLTSFLNAEGFTDFGENLERAVTDGLATMFNIDPATLEAARERGGSSILNILEETFLGPVVRFFRGPFLNVVKGVVRKISGAVGWIVSGVRGFFSKVFKGIFGDDESDTFMGGISERIAGGSSDRESLATRLLNNLEDTFLGPIVRFFRGPFADAVEGVGNWAGGLFNAIFKPTDENADDSIITRVADFLADNGLKGLIDFLRGDSLKTAWDNVFNFFAPMVRTIWSGIQTAYNVIKPIVKPLIDWVGDIVTAFKDMNFEDFDFGNIAKGAGIGLLAGAVVGGPIGAIAGAGIGAAFGAGLGGAIVDSLGNVWTTVEPELDKLWGKITGWAATTFTGENLGKAAFFILDLLVKAGRVAGEIVGDPRFAAALTAAAAAAAGVIGAFTLGFALGILNNVDEWTTLISNGLTTAWDAVTLKLSDLPIIGPIIDVVRSLLDNSVLSLQVGFAAAGLAGLIFTSLASHLKKGPTGAPGSIARGGFSLSGIATGLATSLFSTLGATFTALIRGAGGLSAMIFGGTLKTGRMGIGKNSLGQKRAFSGVGQAIGGSLMAAIAAGITGYVAGSEGGAGSIILGLLTGTLTGASMGAALGFGAPGALIGAALGLAISGVGAFFGAQSAATKKATDEINEYADALRGVGKAGQGAAAATVVMQNLEAETAGVVELITMSGFDIAAFAQQVVDGSLDAETAFTNMMSGITRSAEFGDLTADQQISLSKLIGKFAEASEAGEAFSDETIFMAIHETPGAREALDALGLSVTDLQDAYGFVNDESGELTKGIKKAANLDTIYSRMAGEAEGAAQEVMSLDEATQGLIAGIQSGWGQAEIGVFLNTSGLDVDDQLAAIEGAADDAADALNDMKQAAIDAFGAITDQSLADALDDFELALEQFVVGEGESPIVVDSAQFRRDADGLADDIQSALAEGMENGSIDSSLEFDRYIQGLRDRINGMNLSQDVKDELLGIVNQYSALEPDWEEIYNQERAAAAMERAVFFAGNAGAQKYQAYVDAHPYSYDAMFGARGNESGVGATGQSPSQWMDAQVGTSVSNSADSYIASMGFTASNVQTVVSLAIQDGMKGVDVSGMKNLEGFDEVGTGATEDIARGITAGTPKVVEASQAIGVSAAGAIGNKGVTTAAILAGVEIAGMIVAGLEVGTPEVETAAQGLSSAAALAISDKAATADANAAGVSIAKGIAVGIGSGNSDVETAARDAVAAAADAISDKGPAADAKAAGVAIAKAVARGIDSGRSNVVSAARDLVEAAGSASSKSAVTDMYYAGRAMGQGLVNGLNSMLASVQAAARNIAIAAANAAKAASGIHSPSTVFRGIGHDIGAGLMLGIEDTEGDLMSAISTAIEDAINDATDTAQAVAAQAGAAIFQAMFPSQMPGGTSFLDINTQRLALLSQIGGVTGSAFSTASEAFGDETASAFNGAIRALQGAGFELAESLADVVDNVNEAIAHQAEITAGTNDTPLSREEIGLIASGAATLAPWTTAGQANAEAINSSLEAVTAWAQAALASGVSLTTVTQTVNGYVDALRNQAVAAGLSTTEVNTLITAMGLSTTQMAAWAAEVTSLNAATAAGQVNIQMINEQLQSIRDYGLALLEAGYSASTVRTELIRYRDALVTQLAAFGFNTAQINALVEAAGLSNSALSAFITQMQAFAQEARNAEAAAAAAAKAAADKVAAEQLLADERAAANAMPIGRPAVETLNVYIPYGDPESVGLAVANRIAYDSVSSW